MGSVPVNRDVLAASRRARAQSRSDGARNRNRVGAAMMADAIFDHDRLDVYCLANRLDVDADGDEDRRDIMRWSITKTSTSTSTASLSTSTNGTRPTDAYDE